MKYADIIVVGAGAAGLVAAGRAASGGRKVLLLERNEKVGRKIAITGKGRCNVTNAATGRDFAANIVTGGRFLYSALARFSSEDLMRLIEENGTPLKTERGGRVFPVSDSSFDIIDALLRYAKKNGAGLRTGVEVKTVRGAAPGGKERFVLETTDGEYGCRELVLATGGLSYPVTGSDGAGYRFAKALGHTLVPTRPGLIPLETKEKWPAELTGLTLKNVGLRVTLDGAAVEKDFGELSFAPFGVTGPLVLTASSLLGARLAAEGRGYGDGVQLHLDLKPALTEEELDKRLRREFTEGAKAPLRQILAELLPHKMIAAALTLTGLSGEKKGAEISKAERTALRTFLKDLVLTVTGPRPIEEAVITAGGIPTAEVDPKTMESKRCEGLYLAGELLDIDALTGGFNLQLAFSTGYSAGEALRTKEEA